VSRSRRAGALPLNGMKCAPLCPVRHRLESSAGWPDQLKG
jgi:hypothetical protein